MPPPGSLPLSFLPREKKKCLELASLKVFNHTETLTMCYSQSLFLAGESLRGLDGGGSAQCLGTRADGYLQLDEETAGLRIPKI